MPDLDIQSWSDEALVGCLRSVISGFQMPTLTKALAVSVLNEYIIRGLSDPLVNDLIEKLSMNSLGAADDT